MDIVRDPAVHGGAVPASPPPNQNAAAPRGTFDEVDARRTAKQTDAETRPSIGKVIEELRAAFSARFHLFELEAKRAAWAAAYMLAFAVGAALLGVTAWLILIGALIIGAVSLGVPWVAAVVVAIALHVVAVFFLVRSIRAMVENLTFAATRRTLSQDLSSKVQHGRSP